MAIWHGVKVRILTPSSDWIKQQGQELAKYIELRYIPEEFQTRLTICIIDRKSSVITATKDDSKDSSYEAIRFVTFSNSASTVSSTCPHPGLQNTQHFRLLCPDDKKTIAQDPT